MERYEFKKEQMAFIEGMRQPFAVYQFVDKKVVTLALSDGFCKLFGYEDRARAYHDMDHDMYKDVHPDDAARIASVAIQFATRGGRYEVIYRTKRPGGAGYMVIHALGEHVMTETGVQIAHVWYTEEGDYKEGSGSELSRLINNALHEESILKANRYDYLTGLPNMTYFFELAEAERKVMRAAGVFPALLYINLLGMKRFNQKYGFSEGDRLLRFFAKLLSSLFHNENCCHIGADHFAVIADENGLESMLRRLFDMWQGSYGGKTLPVCVGIYPGRIEEVPVSSAYDRAKIACDAIRGNYSSGFNYYSQEMRDDLEKQQYILENFDRAIEERWIQVYYQPIIRAVNGKVCDEEALARWIDPVRGFLPPFAFIPYLEDAGLIYKLDLYVLERVLEDMKTKEAAGLYVVSHSINLSRSDFDACDIVEEVRERVDAAGIPRSLISVEITESVIGSNFDFMKEQVERFQMLGFPVWMDDFGSGYSSLDVLRGIKFDLLKFDMGFMRKLDESHDGRIILSELIKMAIALHVDTVCEGVETEAQMRFLQESGCSKLQGYYFSKPSPLSHVLEWHKEHRQDGYENPEESSYYEAIGHINLFDFATIANEENDAFHNAFNTLPIGIIEVKGDTARFMRSNPSYREFVKRFFHIDLSGQESSFEKIEGDFMKNIVQTCCEQGLRSFYDEMMPDGSVVHSFARRIGVNPVTGNTAVAVAVLFISSPNEGATYVDIARALAADYYNIYVVDLLTDQYTEYRSLVGKQEMTVERHGEDFFESSKRDAHRIFEEDRDVFYAAFNKENIIKALDEQGVFTATYRLMDTGAPLYVNMKVTRMQQDTSRIIIGISIIDSQMKQQAHYEALQKEHATLARVMALTGGFLTLYTINPETGHFIECSRTDDFATLGTPKEGDDFFRQTIENSKRVVYSEDLELFLGRFTKEKVLRAIREKGSFTSRHRIVINGKITFIDLRIAPFKEGKTLKLFASVKARGEDNDA
ncbi:MAG: GGDEF domain-containing protein [Schwartzia sp.]|nr:GGDEF domain-containing protein [Schwartzia sp. (in: firmicutes)]